jgi:hypothetical protein
LLESEGHVLFVREELVRADGLQLTVTDCFAAYVEYASERGWVALSRNKFGQVIGDVVARQHRVTVRHDIPDANGKEQRGWNGLALGRYLIQPTEKSTSEVSESQFSDESDRRFPVARVIDEKEAAENDVIAAEPWAIEHEDFEEGD